MIEPNILRFLGIEKQDEKGGTLKAGWRNRQQPIFHKGNTWIDETPIASKGQPFMDRKKWW